MKKTAITARSREVYRRRLTDKRDDVLSGQGAKIETLTGFGRVAEDDQAQITHDEFVSLHLNSIEQAELRLVEEALDRLRLGGYGSCVNCEEPIPVKRLRAIPWARYCVRCQEKENAAVSVEARASSAVQAAGR